MIPEWLMALVFAAVLLGLAAYTWDEQLRRAYASLRHPKSPSPKDEQTVSTELKRITYQHGDSFASNLNGSGSSAPPTPPPAASRQNTSAKSARKKSLVRGIVNKTGRLVLKLLKAAWKLVIAFFKLGAPVVAGCIAYAAAFAVMIRATHDPILSAGVGVIPFALVWLAAVRGFNSDDPRHMSDARLEAENKRMEAEHKYKDLQKKKKAKTGIDKEIEEVEKQEKLARLRARKKKFDDNKFTLHDGNSDKKGGE